MYNSKIDIMILPFLRDYKSKPYKLHVHTLQHYYYNSTNAIYFNESCMNAKNFNELRNIIF